MTTDLQQQIEEQLALAREIEDKRMRQNEAAFAAERANFLAEYEPRLAAMRDALPSWAHPYIETPQDWDGYPLVRLPELPPVFCRVKRQNDLTWVEFDLMIYDKWDDTFMPSHYWQSEFSLAVKSAVDAKQMRDELLAEKQRPTQPKPSKWVNLDPTRKTLEAIDTGEYAEAQAFGLVAMARELRTLNGWLRTLCTLQGGVVEDEVDPDNAGSY